MIVIDNDVVVAFFTDVEITQAAHALRAVDTEWVAPELLRYEFVAVIRKYVLGRRISLDSARVAVRSFERMILFKPAFDRPTVFDEAFRLDMSPYDVEYLLLARSLNVKLVTNDGGFINRGLPEVTAVRGFAGGR